MFSQTVRHRQQTERRARSDPSTTKAGARLTWSVSLSRVTGEGSLRIAPPLLLLPECLVVRINLTLSRTASHGYFLHGDKLTSAIYNFIISRNYCLIKPRAVTVLKNHSILSGERLDDIPENESSEMVSNLCDRFFNKFIFSQSSTLRDIIDLAWYNLIFDRVPSM